MVPVRHLTKRYRTVTAVDDLGVEVGPARVTGFLGPNGAGETTTLRILLDLAAATISLITLGEK
jgi:ABC-2 type transport system ATP-binding protein